MKRKIVSMALWTSVLLLACSDKNSRVISFEYGAHSDTACAILEGKVYEVILSAGKKDSILPLSNVMVASHDSVNRIYKTTSTDINGRFTMSFFNNGTYDLELKKSGYKPLKMTNYISDSGQTSTVNIIMEKDKAVF